MTLTHRPSGRQYGFTLIEILVVVAILGLLATLVVPDIVTHFRDSQQQKARTDLISIAENANLYFARNHRWPTLLDLAKADENGHRWIEYHRDPWDHDYVPRQDGDGAIVVLSPGPDGIEGTDDDVLPPPPELPR